MKKSFALCLCILIRVMISPLAMAQEIVAEGNPEDANSIKKENAKVSPKEIKPTMGKSWVAYILRQKKSGNIIPFIEFKTLQVPITLTPKDGGLSPIIEIRGTLREPGWKLEVDKERMLVDYGDERDFTIPLYITGRLNIFKLKAIHQEGKHIEETLFIFAPNSEEYIKASAWNSVMVSLGVAGFGYYQTTFGVYKSIVSLLSLRYSPLEVENPLSWFAQLNMTMQTLYSTPVKRGPQLIEGNLSATYRLKSNYDPRLSEQILVGAKYVTMISNDSPFGFSNLISPELAWRLRWKEDNTNYFGGELRLSVLSQDIQKNRGLGAGWFWNRALKNNHNLELGINYSGIVYQADQINEVRTDLFSIKLGYSM